MSARDKDLTDSFSFYCICPNTLTEELRSYNQEQLNVKGTGWYQSYLTVPFFPIKLHLFWDIKIQSVSGKYFWIKATFQQCYTNLVCGVSKKIGFQSALKVLCKCEVMMFWFNFILGSNFISFVLVIAI